MSILDYFINKFSKKNEYKKEKIITKEVLPDYKKKINSSIIEMGSLNTGVFSPSIIKSTIENVLESKEEYSEEVIEKALLIKVDELKISKFGKNTLNISKRK